MTRRVFSSLMAKLLRLLKSFIRLLTGRHAHRDGEREEGEEDLEAIQSREQKVFQYEALVAATHNFSPQMKLGGGGFGPVYQGRLKDGREVAVKLLAVGSKQGVREFTTEAAVLSRVQHKNVVNLYGYCVHPHHRLLVYEFVPNLSLDRLLFSSPTAAADETTVTNHTELDWRRRYEVIQGVARGLVYLHEDAHVRIVHRDIKASNILLDERWNPKITDFGMARLFPEDLTHVDTRVAGTDGYMAPEYLLRGSLSPKADVFSFGVLVLELVSGLRNSAFVPLPDPHSWCLLDWAWKLYKKGQSAELMDPALRSTAVPEQVVMCVHLGLLCTQADPKLRPDMNRVMLILSKRPSKLEEPHRPGIPSSEYRRGAYEVSGSHYTGGSYSTSISASTSASSSNANNTATTSTASIVRSQRLPAQQEENLKPDILVFP